MFEELFPRDPEMQFARITHGMYAPATLRELLAGARFREVRIEPRRMEFVCPDARTLATGMIRGTPRVSLIEQRGKSLEDVIERATVALAKVGGAQPFRSHAQAVVVEARAL